MMLIRMADKKNYSLLYTGVEIFLFLNVLRVKNWSVSLTAGDIFSYANIERVSYYQ